MSTVSTEVNEKYNLELVTKIISNYKFQSIAIQLPDSMLNDSIYIYNAIQNKLKDKNININSNISEKENCTSCVCLDNRNTTDEKNDIKDTLKDDLNKTSKDGSSDKTNEHTNIYVLGDTTLNECCEDYVSADHVHADFLIHYGTSCQSFIIPYTPSIYVFSKKKLPDNFFANINKYVSEKNASIKNKMSVILCDVSYESSMNDIVASFIDKNQFGESLIRNNNISFHVDNISFTNNSFYKNCVDKACLKINNDDEYQQLTFTNVIICIQRIANNLNKKVYYGFFDNYVEFDIEEKLTEKYLFICGRLLFKVFYNVKKKNFVYRIVSNEEKLLSENVNIYVLPADNDHLLNRSLLEFGSDYDIFIYDAKRTFTSDNNINKILLKRYSLIEKCKTCDVFGILIGNVNLDKNRELRKLINYIIRKNKKKCFTIVTNKVNSAKLENFNDIDMYILITCNENSLLELTNFSKKIINPYEFFIAYNYLQWDCKYILEFHQLLNFPSIKKEFDNMHMNKYILWRADKEVSSIKNEEADEGCPQNDFDSFILENTENLLDHDSSMLAEQKKFITTFNDKSKMCEYFISSLKENDKREFKGVEMDYNIDKIPNVVQGLHGIAQKYDMDVKLLGKTDEVDRMIKRLRD